MVSWWQDGSFAAMERDSLGVLYFAAASGRFASQGSVDVGLVTRKGSYEAPCVFNKQTSVYAAGRLTYRPNETNSGRRLTAMLTIVPASTFPANYVPTPREIYSGVKETTSDIRSGSYAGGRQHFKPDHPDQPAGNGARWLNGGSSSDPTNIEPYFNGPEYRSLPTGTKFWAALIPVWIHQDNWNRSNIASVAWTVGNTDIVGRAVSFWTSRTPLTPTFDNMVDNQLVPSGSTIDLKIKPTHPDVVLHSTGDINVPWFRDLAGVQVQYSPRPTQDEPDPEWVDLPFATTGSSPSLGRGWWIENAALSTSTAGLKALRDNLTVKVRCGGAGLLAGAGALPSGEWRLRFRTFSYGVSDAGYFPDLVADFSLSGPLASKYPDHDRIHNRSTPMPGDGPWTPNTYTASTYPAAHTSPWSKALQISVTSQVPPPLLRYPTGGAAVVVNTAVLLSWQYRNTAMPPNPQVSRTVQLRKRGDTNWTTLVSGNSSAASYTIPADYGLVSGTAYEWRVQVADLGITSDYSASGLFWVVPQPASGPTRPEAPDTVDGATLGIGTHRAFIFRRGGKRRVAELTNIVKIDWGRTRDEISTAEVQIGSWDLDSGRLLASLKTWAYELVIIRDNGFSQHRVWEGPITLITYERDMVTIDAKDVMAYAYRRIIKQTMNDNSVGDSVVSRATRILQNVFAADDPNLLSYLNPIANGGDARQYRALPTYSRTAYEEIDDMAANAGLDYTVIARSIMLWGTKYRIGTLPELRDKDLGASPIVSEYGMSFANRYVVSDGNGIYGQATRLNDDGLDPDYGLVEMLSSTWAQDAEQDTGTYTQEGIETIRASFAEHAERSISDRYPPPMVVRIPDNTSLNPDTVLSIQQLVPGVVIPLRSVATLRTVKANQKLDSLKVTETDGTETIQVTMSPFNRDDNDQTEEGL